MVGAGHAVELPAVHMAGARPTCARRPLLPTALYMTTKQVCAAGLGVSLHVRNEWFLALVEPMKHSV
jgi:hypothetical protein